VGVNPGQINFREGHVLARTSVPTGQPRAFSLRTASQDRSGTDRASGHLQHDSVNRLACLNVTNNAITIFPWTRPFPVISSWSTYLITSIRPSGSWVSLQHASVPHCSAKGSSAKGLTCAFLAKKLSPCGRSAAVADRVSL
jgi:hypothetical protein